MTGPERLEAPSPQPAERPEHMGPVRVAVACGTLGQRERVAKALQAEGVTAEVAERTDVEWLAAHNPDAIVLLRSGDPRGVCRRLKRNPRTSEVPVLVFSQPGALDEKMGLVNAGADELIDGNYGEQGLGEHLLRFVSERRVHKRWMRADAVLGAFAQSAERHGTQQHAQRTMEVADRIAEEVGLTVSERTSLRRAAMLHDIGELALPDQMMLKPGQLSAVELEALRSHPEMGAEIISVVLGDEAAAAAVRAHHERLDGSGYPRGLRGSEVPVMAQILGLADTYAAATAPRPHRPGLTVEAALQLVHRATARGQFEKRLVEILERVAPKVEEPAESAAVVSLRDVQAAVVLARPEMRRDLAKTLTEAGCVVRHARDHADARVLLTSTECAMVVVDLQVDSGGGVVRSAREAAPDAEVLAVLSEGTLAEASAAMQAGANEVIDPAAGSERAGETLARAAQRWRARRSRREALDDLLMRMSVMERVSAERESRITELEDELQLAREARATMAKELEQMRLVLIRSERFAQVGRMTSSIVHEINNPLAFVRSNLTHLVEQLTPGAMTDDLADALKDAADGVERIVTIVRDVRAYSRADNGVMVQLDPNRVVKVSENLLRGLAKQRTELAIELGRPPAVRGEENPLVQVVTNLVVNAIDAAGPHGRVIVRTGPAPEGAMIQVEDNGAGIPQEIQDRIFEPFFTTKPPETGTGMGLTICRTILDRMGGTLSFESRPGCTVFTAWLPAALDPHG